MHDVAGETLSAETQPAMTNYALPHDTPEQSFVLLMQSLDRDLRQHGLTSTVLNCGHGSESLSALFNLNHLRSGRSCIN